MRPRTAGITGWALVGLTVVLSAPALLIAATDPAGPSGTASLTSPRLVAMVFAISLAASLVGALILSKRPENGIGWLFAVNGPLIIASWSAYAYGHRALIEDPGSLPGGHVAAWAADITDPLILGLATVFLFLLFPEGRLQTRAKRRTALVAIVGIGLAMAGAIVEPTLQDYEDVATPLAPPIPSAVSWSIVGLGLLAFLGATVASIRLLIGRLRRSTGRERDQLRLLVWATAVATALIVPTVLSPPSASWSGFAYLLGGLGFLLIPVSVGIAILRHRLLDIDLVIRRTVIVALLGAFISAVYVGIVVGVGTLVGNRTSPVLSAAAAAVVALAFQPGRRRAQRVADRLVYGERATPYEVLAVLAERMGETYAASDLLPRIARVVAEGTGADRTTVWLRVGEELRPAAAWPPEREPEPPVRALGDELPPLPAEHAVPVTHRGELLGALTLDKPEADPLSPTEDKLVRDVASQSGLALRNIGLTEELRVTIDELRASRQRLVRAQDEERRKLERNIHDGAQQQLVALAVKVRMAESTVPKDPGGALAILAQVREDATDALESLRDLARGIFPPLLADEGLSAALEAQARKAAVPVEVRSDGIGRYPQEVEATVYFCCLEALQNAAKYAEASRVEIHLSDVDGLLTFEVRDEGRGFDPRTTPRGAGLQNMTDRLEAVGGSLQIRSAPGAGTTLLGRVPSGAGGPVPASSAGGR